MDTQQLIEQSDNIFKVLTQQSTQGISVADIHGNYIFVNPAFCKMVGYSSEELLNLTVFDMKAPNQDHSSFEQSKNSKEKHAIKVMLQRKDGSIFPAEVIGKKITFENKECVLGTVQDISERVETERALLESDTRYQLAMKVANDGVWDWHIKTNLVEYDERYYTMAGYKKDAFPYTLEEWKKRVHPDDITHAMNAMDLYMQGKARQYDIEFRFLCQDNSYMWIRSRGKVIQKDEHNNAVRFIGTHSDISVQKKHEEKILYQAHFDSLTYLPNRFLSLDRLKHACIEANRNKELVALLFLDLDDFKKVNDTLGHETGDRLLQEAANRLRGVVRSVDTVGRLGGDEFIIILGGLKSVDEAHPIIDNLLNQFREMFVIHKRELLLTASVGVAIYPNDARDSSELLRNADSAMYDAKNCGRNTFSYYTAQMNQCAQRRLAIEEQIHGALNRNEFSVFYQVKTNLSNGKIMGAEALLRWNNPALGNVPPDEFIAIAEQTGNIIQLGKFVLEQSLKQTALWHKEYQQDFQIAVNLSPRQFRDPQLVQFIDDTLKANNVHASNLELEITEGVLLSGYNYVESMLNSITQMGVKMAMDDFGTGYSSLSYLRTYPFDVIKIDRSFINEIATAEKDRALINAIISMSHALNLKVVAEGIETEEQCQYLRKVNCDLGQGYLFSKPISAQAMTKLLDSTFQINK
ncbi:EAL domain-containing protein [Litorilituus lipolyticus]|uniref:cyclic-guanylate-specific phosphodiesterase n=1 Tax=Litorilituus lipolyticus TaxID=2491017 RepID=A0A502KRE7_9GAMM|nr:EAL domain-containing protein [Litorilituus lipolyticus]TPH12919.1 EAL domain-containing protein [Litorilituus lipolyticus]